MITHRKLSLAGLCLVVLVAVSAFSQGLYWESTTSGGPMGDKANISQNYAMPKMFKIVSQGKVMILRMDQQKIYDVDPVKKTYSVMTFDEMEAYAKKAGDKMAEFREKIKNLPPDQQKKMEALGAMMGGAADAPVQVAATGEKKTISGMACTQYILKRGGKDLATLWVTKDVSGFDNIRKDWMEFGKRMATLTNMSGMGEAYMKIDGFPMETDMDMMGRIQTVVTKVEKRSTAAAEFDLPAGLTKTDSPLMQKMGN